jgi:hypothetical protein
MVVPLGTRSEVTKLTWLGNESQAELVRRWLGAPAFGPKQGQAIPLGAHDNFHGVQTVL